MHRNHHGSQITAQLREDVVGKRGKGRKGTNAGPVNAVIRLIGAVRTPITSPVPKPPDAKRRNWDLKR
ncbi:MAG: hypothetical protein ACI4SV_03180 [Duodenibacillus sp.]